MDWDESIWDDSEERGWRDRATADVLFLATGLVGGALYVASWLSPLLCAAIGTRGRTADDVDGDL